MKKYFKVALCSILVFSICGCAKKINVLKEDVVEFAKKELNKHQYSIDVYLDSDKHTIGGTMDVEIKNNSNDDWQEIYLRDYTAALQEDSKPMTISNVSDGKSELEVIVDNDPTIIKIPLKESLKAHSSMNLHVEYTAYILESAQGRFNYMIDQNDGEKVGRPRYTLGNFYPVLSYYENGKWINHPYVQFAECFYTPVSDYVVQVTSNEAFEFSTTGVLSQEEMLDHHLIKRTFVEKDVRDFSMSAAMDYEVLSAIVDGIVVKSYFYKYHEEMGQVALDEGVNAIKLFNRYLGKYPYAEVDIAAVPYLPGGGMEFPGQVMILQRYYDRGDLKSMSSVVVHELAHQWFYGIVGNDEFDMPFIDESTATFMEYVYAQYFDEEKYEMKLRLDEHPESDVDPIVTKAYDEYGGDAVNYIGAVYSVGGRFLNKVRLEMGDVRFMEALREFVATYAYQEARVEDLIEVLNKHSNKSLDDLYKEHLEPEYYD